VSSFFGPESVAGGGGGAPSGAAGGGLSGTYPNPTVATNANLTGPITSVGNATSIASQTGTGTKFVVDTSPTLVTPILGVATATSINGNAVTTGTGTLTLGSATLNAGVGGTLGSNAFTSTAYLPLAGGTLTGLINETVAGSVFGAVNTGTAAITITNQTTALPAPVNTNGVQIVGSGTGVGNNPAVELTAYSGLTNINFRLAGGSIGTPAVTINQKTIGGLAFYGYDLTNGFMINANYLVQSLGTFSTSNHGTLHEWFSTAQNSTSMVSTMVLYQGLWVGPGSGSSDPGIGNQQLTGRIGLGSTTLPVGQAGDIAQIKETDAAAAPGAGYAVLKWVAGTNSGTGKLICYAGTSTTPVTIVDNVGAGF